MKNMSKGLLLTFVMIQFEIGHGTTMPEKNVDILAQVAKSFGNMRGVNYLGFPTRDGASSEQEPSEVVTLKGLVGSATATVAEIQAAILAVAATTSIDLLAVRNTINTLISQVYFSWISAIDTARADNDTAVGDAITNTFKPAAQAFAEALNANTGFSQRQDLVNHLAQTYTLMLGSAAVYEIFVADTNVKKLITKNSQTETDLASATDAAKQEISLVLAVLSTSNVVQTNKDNRLTTGLNKVNEQRSIASSIMGAAALGNA